MPDRHVLARLALALLLLGCARPAPDAAAVAAEIQAQLDRVSEATRRKDIEAYMATFPDDWVLHDESGEVVDRAQQRRNILRDWAVIDTTLELVEHVDSLHVAPDSALVWVSQRWKRMMFERDGVTRDTVLTTQRHLETWRRTAQGWRGDAIVELGGAVWVNGRPYR